MNSGKKKMAISGAGGFIGSYLVDYFTGKDWEVIPLHRQVFEVNAISELKNILSSCEVVINLAGAPILHLWTASYKKEIKESRIHVTRSLVTAINEIESKPDLFISASAIGFYPSGGRYDESYNQNSGSFLSEVCQEWEIEAQKVSSEVRLAITRFGVVLASEGGAFEQMTRFSKRGIAAVLGPGSQAFPWISIQDLSKAMDFIVVHKKEYGIYNFTTPEFISYKDFIRLVAQKNNSLLTITIPPFLLKVGLGEATFFVTGTSYVYPSHLINEGFVYLHPTIQDFLNDL